MKSNIIEEISQKKKYYDEEEQQLNRKKETLEESKKILEAESIDTKSIDIAIKSYKEKIEKVKESKKKIAAILKTMKSSKTKIKNRVNKIISINEEITIIKENLERLKKQNNNENTSEEFEIWNRKLDEATKKLIHEYKIIQGARTAKERAVQRYEAILNGTPYNISKKKTKSRAKKREKYKAVLESETIEKVQTEVVEEKKNEAIEKVQAEVVEKTKTEAIEKAQAEVVEKTKTEAIEKAQAEVVEETKTEAIEKVQAEVVEETKTEAIEKAQTEVEEEKETEELEKSKPEVVKETKIDKIRRIKNKVKDVSYITLYESTGKIEIDGVIKNIDRHAYIDTEEEIKEICEDVLDISRRIELKRIMSKIDYAIVNGIKDVIMDNNNLKKLNEENKEILKQQQKKAYIKKITDYIKTLKSSDKYRLPFVLQYDCTGKMSKRDYISINKYINVGEEIGAIVEGKRNLFIYREEVKPDLKRISLGFENKTQREDEMIKKIEGDKSFVPKVNIEFGSVSNVNLNEVTFLYQKNAKQKANNRQYDRTL